MQYSRFFITNQEITVGVKAPQEVEIQLRRYFFPFAEVEKEGVAAWEIECVFAYNLIHLHPQNKAENGITIDSSIRSICIPYDGTIWSSISVFRVIRNIFRLEYANMGNTLFLHGGIVNIDGKGILYLGTKGSGKTSSILGMLSLGKGASYACNDDAIIRLSGTLMGIGSARSISIRRNTLPILEKVILPHFIPEEHPSNQLLTEQDYLTIYPRQLSEIFQNSICKTSSIDAIVFPSITKEEGFLIQSLSKEKILSGLMGYCEEPIDTRHSFLQGLIGKMQFDAVLKELSGLPAFKVSHSLSAVKDSATKLRRMICG